jgi:hypothetical protein
MAKTIGIGTLFILAGFVLMAVNQLAYAQNNLPLATQGKEPVGYIAAPHFGL